MSSQMQLTQRTPLGRGGWAVAIVTVLVTLTAIALATAAPFVTASGQPGSQSGWVKIYDKNLVAASTEWELAEGCQITARGIDVVAGGERMLCTFAPSAETDYLGRGFQLDLTLAPGASVPRNEEAFIVLGMRTFLVMDQSGQFELCEGQCSRRSDSTATGTTITWHGSGFTENVLTLRSLGSGQPLEFLVNGQLVTSIPFAYDGTRPTIQIGATRGSEALFTHMRLTSATTA